MPGMSILTAEERAIPLLFREEFRSRDSVIEGGVAIIGTGVTFNNGLVLDGNGNLSWTISGLSVLAPTMTFKIPFTLGFAPDDGVLRYLFDTGVTGTGRFFFRKNADNTLRVYMGGTGVLDIAYATWSAALAAGKNTLIISTTSGATSAWLNGTLIGTSATAWSYRAAPVTKFTLGSNYLDGNRWIGTIHPIEIYGSVSTTLDEQKLRLGTLLTDLDDPWVLLPGKSFYKRASDNKFVTEAMGSSGIREALMGSDGLTVAQFPSIVKPRGFSYDGGDQINLEDSDALSFTDGVNDLPFSLVSYIRVDDVSTYRSIMTKAGVALTNGEWSFYMFNTKILFFALIDDSTGGYVYRTTTFTVKAGLPIVAIATYSGALPGTNARIYVNGIRADTFTGSAGVYTRMRNTAYAAKVGVFGAAGTPMIGRIGLPQIFNKEISPFQARVLTARINEQMRRA